MQFLLGLLVFHESFPLSRLLGNVWVWAAAALSRAPDGAPERCLAHLGLENGSAAKDIRELRDLLEAWRDARRTAWQTTVKVITTGILAALLVGAAIKLKLMGGVQ